MQAQDIIESPQDKALPVPPGEKVWIRGFFRVHIVNQDGSLHGDSGWRDNLITNEGFRNFLARLIGGISGSSQITHAALGTGGAPAAGDTTLAGEQSVRAAVTAATSSTSKAVVFTATFDSAVSFVTATKNISNIALAATSTAAAATIFAGNTYASSSVATNQNVRSYLRHLLVTASSKLNKFGGSLSLRKTIPSQACV